MELRVQWGKQVLIKIIKKKKKIIHYLITNCDKIKMKEKLTKTLNTSVGGPDLVWDASLERWHLS